MRSAPSPSTRPGADRETRHGAAVGVRWLLRPRNARNPLISMHVSRFSARNAVSPLPETSQPTGAGS